MDPYGIFDYMRDLHHYAFRHIVRARMTSRLSETVGCPFAAAIIVSQ